MREASGVAQGQLAKIRLRWLPKRAQTRVVFPERARLAKLEYPATDEALSEFWDLRGMYINTASILSVNMRGRNE